jgi:hypothetical protein
MRQRNRLLGDLAGCQARLSEASMLRACRAIVALSWAGVALVFLANAAAGQSPFGCNANGLEVFLAAQTSVVENGELAEYTVDVRNNPLSQVDACDVRAAFVQFCCPGADGNPGPECTLLPVTSGPCLVNGPNANCAPTAEAMAGLDLPADGSNDKVNIALTCRVGLVSPGAEAAIARVAVEEGYLLMQTFEGLPQAERARVVPVLVSRPTPTPTGTPTRTPVVTPDGAGCVGDCNGLGEVTVNEILLMINIALGKAETDECTRGDANGDGEITVDEILTAVNHALDGCPEATATATPSATVTATPTGDFPICSIGSPPGCSGDRSTLALQVDEIVVPLGGEANYTVDLRNNPLSQPDACDVANVRATFCCPGADGNPGTDCTLLPVENVPCRVNGPQADCLPTQEAMQGIALPGDGSNDKVAIGKLRCQISVDAGVTSAIARASFNGELDSICRLEIDPYIQDLGLAVQRPTPTAKPTSTN